MRVPNPIYTAELHHQWYIMEKSRSGRVWILLALVLLVPAALTSLVLFFGALLFNLSIPGVPILTAGSINLLIIGQVTLLIANIALYIVILLISFGLASNSITREKRNKTWDNLILTSISARQLVWGKWRASLVALYGDHLLLGVLRLGMVAWMIVGFRDRLPVGAVSIPAHILLFTGIVLLFTLLDALFTTALGIAVVLADAPGSIAFSLFMAVRGTATIYSFWLFVRLVQRLFSVPDASYFLYGLLGLAVYAAGILILLWAAERVAVRQSLVSPAVQRV